MENFKKVLLGKSPKFYKKILTIFGAVLISNIILYFSFPKLLELGIKDQVSLKKRNKLRSIYLEIPFPLLFDIYFFNVVNPEDVQNGAKPKLEEIGPFCYDLYKKKVQVVDDKNSDTLSYKPYDIIKFNPKRSGALTEDAVVTILNPFLVGAVNLVKRMSPGLLGIVNKALATLLSNPKSIYITTDVHTLLWSGLTINCSSKDSIVKAVCGQIKSNMPDIIEREKGVFLFSLLGNRNATLGKKIIVKRGIKDNTKLGELVEYDNKKELNLWGSAECNTFDGTDGWIFPPFIKVGDDLKVFSTDLCRNIRIKYEGPSTYKNVKVNKYIGGFGDQSSDPNEKCYCPSPKTCLKKGVFDLSKCLGVPLIGSLPHFYGADETFLSQIEGLQPDKDKHIIFLKTEPYTTAPVEGFLRFQANLQVAKNNKITQMQNVPTALHPILWFEQGTQLDGKLLGLVTIVDKIKTVVHIFIWAVFFICFVGLGLSGYMYHTKVRLISPVEPFTADKFEETPQKEKSKNYRFSSAVTAIVSDKT